MNKKYSDELIYINEKQIQKRIAELTEKINSYDIKEISRLIYKIAEQAHFGEHSVKKFALDRLVNIINNFILINRNQKNLVKFIEKNYRAVHNQQSGNHEK